MAKLEKENTDEFDQQEFDNSEQKKKKGILPVFLLSGLIHSILILFLIFIIVSTAKKPTEDIIITTKIAEVKEEEEKPEEKRDIIKTVVEVKVETEIQTQPTVTTEEVSEVQETDNNMELATAEGTNEGISDSPQVGSGLMGNIGGGGGGGGTFGSRSGGGKKKAIMRGGGSAKTESSVDAALRWLMRHQEKDGHWDGVKYGNLGGDEHSAPDQAQTGLATLAFLAAGHTPKIGKYKNTVKTAVEWLLSKQNANGSFNSDKRDHIIYENSICALALAETYAMHPDPKVKEAAQKAIDYLATVPSGQVHFNTNKDGVPLSMSVLGWMMMAFKSAKIAGLNVPEDTFAKYKARVDEMTEKDQSGNPMKTHYLKLGDRTAKSRFGNTMTAVGMLVYEYTGVHRSELDLMADLLIKDVPAVGKDYDIYRWYYATLSMFQYGGAKWKTWNTALVETLVGTQCKGGPLDGSLQDIDGSWEYAHDEWGKKAGRVYQTAMSAFCLEVYYRYESILK
jgi:hypothetical protein